MYLDKCSAGWQIECLVCIIMVHNGEYESTLRRSHKNCNCYSNFFISRFIIAIEALNRRTYLVNYYHKESMIAITVSYSDI